MVQPLIINNQESLKNGNIKVDFTVNQPGVWQYASDYCAYSLDDGATWFKAREVHDETHSEDPLFVPQGGQGFLYIFYGPYADSEENSGVLYPSVITRLTLLKIDGVYPIGNPGDIPPYMNTGDTTGEPPVTGQPPTTGQIPGGPIGGAPIPPPGGPAPGVPPGVPPGGPNPPPPVGGNDPGVSGDVPPQSPGTPNPGEPEAPPTIPGDNPQYPGYPGGPVPVDPPVVPLPSTPTTPPSSPPDPGDWFPPIPYPSDTPYGGLHPGPSLEPTLPVPPWGHFPPTPYPTDPYGRTTPLPTPPGPTDPPTDPPDTDDQPLIPPILPPGIPGGTGPLPAPGFGDPGGDPVPSGPVVPPVEIPHPGGGSVTLPPNVPTGSEPRVDGPILQAPDFVDPTVPEAVRGNVPSLPSQPLPVWGGAGIGVPGAVGSDASYPYESSVGPGSPVMAPDMGQQGLSVLNIPPGNPASLPGITIEAYATPSTIYHQGEVVLCNARIKNSGGSGTVTEMGMILEYITPLGVPVRLGRTQLFSLPATCSYTSSQPIPIEALRQSGRGFFHVILVRYEVPIGDAVVAVNVMNTPEVVY